MPSHIHPLPAKDYALGFESHPLLKGRAAAQLDLTSGADDAVPWKPDGAAKNRSNLPGASAQTCGSTDCAVGRNHSPRNQVDCGDDSRSRR